MICFFLGSHLVLKLLFFASFSISSMTCQIAMISLSSLHESHTNWKSFYLKIPCNQLFYQDRQHIRIQDISICVLRAPTPLQLQFNVWNRHIVVVAQKHCQEYYTISITARPMIFPSLRSWNALPDSSKVYFLETAWPRSKIPVSANLINFGRSCLALPPYEPITFICSNTNLI